MVFDVDKTEYVIEICVDENDETKTPSSDLNAISAQGESHDSDNENNDQVVTNASRGIAG